MKSVVVNRILIVLMISVIFSPSFVQTSIAEEKWEANMKKDFTKVLREKKKPAEKHREFILKWQKQGRLSTLLDAL